MYTLQPLETGDPFDPSDPCGRDEATGFPEAFLLGIISLVTVPLSTFRIHPN